MIASVSSDIGAFLARRFVANKDNVCGTYRDYAHVPEDLRSAGIRLFKCDVDSAPDVKTLKDELRNQGFRWDLLISAVGVLSPIGRFVDLDFTKWEKSVTTNSISQLRLLHGLYELRTTGRMANVVFFAGGGTNGLFVNCSAYSTGKIALIKICQLLDSNCTEMYESVIGTVQVRSKIHAQTLAAGENSDQ